MNTVQTFHYNKYGQSEPNIIEDSFLLTKDSWDDFGMHVKFRINYIDKDGDWHKIGAIKIISYETNSKYQLTVPTNTQLPKKFNKLEKNFISLGQNEDYYRNMYSLFGENCQDVLLALRDIALYPAFGEDLEPTSAFRNALTRDNSATRAKRLGRVWARGESPREKMSFSYRCRIDGAELPIETDVNFDSRDEIPGRIIGIIGRNAVGKTRFLAQLSEDLAQTSRTSAERIAERDKRFPDERPLFSRIIAVSYSAFDRFKRPASDSSSSYVYCGIRNDKGSLSKSSLIETYRKNQNRIREYGRQSEWAMHIYEILGPLVSNLILTPEEEILNDDSNEGSLSVLSSGQSILCHYVTALIAWLQPHSLVLFDEPETHLHPNAVASLMLVLQKLLDKYDSYAVIATHSALVIQEIPSQRVKLFQREDYTTTSENLKLESFGEDISELTRHVFETVEINSVYKNTLKELAANYTPEQVMQKFPKGLSLNAQAYLLAQYKPKK